MYIELLQLRKNGDYATFTCTEIVKKQFFSHKNFVRLFNEIVDEQKKRGVNRDELCAICLFFVTPAAKLGMKTTVQKAQKQLDELSRGLYGAVTSNYASVSNVPVAKKSEIDPTVLAKLDALPIFTTYKQLPDIDHDGALSKPSCYL